MQQAGRFPRSDPTPAADGALRTDVLVVGCGPAGAAAARDLALRGHGVVLVDRASFPRDKICGDALLPDAIGALERLGLLGRVEASARPLRALRLHAPRGGHVALDAGLLCLPRLELDEILRAAAVEAGARFIAPCRPVGPIEEGGAVAGATLLVDAAAAMAAATAPGKTAGPVGAVAQARDDEARDDEAAQGAAAPLRVQARFTLLATGAAARPLQLFGMCERTGASAIAARMYVQAGGALAARCPQPCISYTRHVCPGYGWVFPGPGGRFNVGVGYFHDAPAPPTTNLRELLARFAESFAPARELLAGASAVTELRGAPIRTALQGARLARPGLLVIGEAAGLTYPFSGEGIGKAMESGLLASSIVSEALSRAGQGMAPDRAAAAQRYEHAIRRSFGERFRAYALAQRWLAHPSVIDFFVERAGAGRFVRRQLEGLVTETADPRTLFSIGGVLRSLSR